MREFVVVGCGQMRAHATIRPGNYHAAAAGRCVLIDEIGGSEIGVLARGGQDVGVFVAADAADVEDGGGGKDVLRLFNSGIP